jgi:hypothetical protein
MLKSLLNARVTISFLFLLEIIHGLRRYFKQKSLLNARVTISFLFLLEIIHGLRRYYKQKSISHPFPEADCTNKI